MLTASSSRGIPRIVWALGLVSSLMGLSSELVHSLLAGWLWQEYGAALTCCVGAGFAAVSLLLSLRRHLL